MADMVILHVLSIAYITFSLLYISLFTVEVYKTIRSRKNYQTNKE